MKLKQVSYYRPEEKWYTICCGVTSKGRRCSNCQERPKEKVFMPQQHYGFMDFSVQTNGKETVVSHCISSVELNIDELDLSWGRKEQIRLTLNHETGEILIHQPKAQPLRLVQKRNTFGGESVLKEIMKVKKGIVQRFLNHCFQTREIYYRKSKNFPPTTEGWDQLQRLLFQPNLQLLPFVEIPVLSEDENEKTKHTTKGKEMIGALLGHNSNGFIKRIRSVEHYYVAKIWAPHFKKVDNINRILDELEGKGNGYAFPDSRQTVNLSSFYQGMKLLGSFHLDETVFANRVLTSLKKRGKQVTSFVREVADIMEMVQQLQEKDPAYPLVFQGDISVFHDVLAKDHRRIVKGEKIEYTYENEVEWEKDIDHHTFRLAKDSVELARVGSDMNICVGSYNPRVKKGDCRILYMKHEESEQTDVCIEVRNQMVVQAKIKYNELPDAHQCGTIRKWANECGFSIQTDDIQFKETQNA